MNSSYTNTFKSLLRGNDELKGSTYFPPNGFNTEKSNIYSSKKNESSIFMSKHKPKDRLTFTTNVEKHYTPKNTLNSTNDQRKSNIVFNDNILVNKNNANSRESKTKNLSQLKSGIFSNDTNNGTQTDKSLYILILFK